MGENILKRRLPLLLTILLTAAVSVACGKEDSPPRGGEDMTADTSDTGTDIAIDGFGEQSENGRVLYSFGGVTLSFEGVEFFEDGSAVMGYSAVSDNDDLTVWFYSEGEPDSGNISLGNRNAVNRLSMRLFLEDGEGYVEGSLSDVITVDISDKLRQPSRISAAPLYEDDSIKLGFVGCDYGEIGDGSAKILLSAENKTDRDIFICSRDSETVHTDYYFDIQKHIPAKSGGYISVYFGSLNSTLRDWDLESFAFALAFGDSEEIIKKYGSHTWSAVYDPDGQRLPQDGLISFVIPENIRPQKSDMPQQEEISTEEYTDRYFEDNEYANAVPVKAVGFRSPQEDKWDLSGAVFENDEVRLEYAFTADSDYGREVCFKAYNKLDRQIEIDFLADCGGIMTQVSPVSVRENSFEFISLTFSEDISGGLTDRTDIVMRVRYDDNSYDDSSFICEIPKISILYEEGEIALPPVPEQAQLVYEDENVQVYFLGADKEEYLSGDSLDAEFFVRNLSQSPITVAAGDEEMPEAAEENGIFSGYLDMEILDGAAAYDSMTFYRYSGEDNSAVGFDSLDGYKVSFDITAGGREYQTDMSALVFAPVQ